MHTYTNTHTHTNMYTHVCDFTLLVDNVMCLRTLGSHTETLIMPS